MSRQSKFFVKNATIGSEERTRLEISLRASLAHPNIVPVIDADLKGRPWFSMPRLPETLSDWWGHHISPICMFKVLFGLLDAIGYLHAYGIVHGDIKPENIRMTRTGIPKLTDFEGFLQIGTKGWRAPETGKSTRDRTEDLYSLGAICWWLTHLNPPDNNLIWMPFFSIPSGLEAWAKALLASDPVDRPESAAAAAQTLQKVFDRPPRLRYSTGPKIGIGILPYWKPPVVGREKEQAQLEHSIRQAWKTKTLLHLTVVGQSGFGSTTLVQQFCHQLDTTGTATVLYGATPEQLVKYWLEQAPATRKAKLLKATWGESLLSIEAGWFQPDSPKESLPQLRSRILTEWLKSLAGPVLIWKQTSELQEFENLFQQLAANPFPIVFLSDLSLPSQDTVIKPIHLNHVKIEEIMLKPLPSKAIQALLDRIDAADYTEGLVDYAGGNPGLALTLLKERVSRQNKRWIPPELKELRRSRLMVALSEQTVWQTAQAAAVLGESSLLWEKFCAHAKLPAKTCTTQLIIHGLAYGTEKHWRFSEGGYREILLSERDVALNTLFNPFLLQEAEQSLQQSRYQECLRLLKFLGSHADSEPTAQRLRLQAEHGEGLLVDEHAKEVGNQAWKQRQYTLLAVTLRLRGMLLRTNDPWVAVALFREAALLANEANDPKEEAWAQLHLANNLRILRRLNKAQSIAESAFKLQHNDLLLHANLKLVYGEILMMEQTQIETAQNQMSLAYSQFKSLQSTYNMARCANSLAALFEHKNQPEEAHSWYQCACESYTRIGSPQRTLALFNLARLAFRRNAPSEAYALLINETPPSSKGRALRLLGCEYALLKLGQPSAELDKLKQETSQLPMDEEIARMLEELGSQDKFFLSEAARIWGQLGKLEEAQRCSGS